MNWKVDKDYYELKTDSYEAAIATFDDKFIVFVGVTDSDEWDFADTASSLQEAKEMAVEELLRQLHTHHEELSDKLAANNVAIEQVKQLAIETKMGL